MSKEDVLQQMIARSAFSKSPNDSFETRLYYFIDALQQHHAPAEENELNAPETLAAMTPEFQRSNDQWSKEMQTSFVENLICGCKTEITLFYLEGAPERCYLLDGLQRSTSVSAFLSNDLPVAGDVYFKDVERKSGALANARVGIKIYCFDTMAQAVSHYISINENISHSLDDINKAKQFRERLLSDAR